MIKIEGFREMMARALIRLAIKVDPGNRMLCQSGEYRLDIGWQQPVPNSDFANRPAV